MNFSATMKTMSECVVYGWYFSSRMESHYFLDNHSVTIYATHVSIIWAIIYHLLITFYKERNYRLIALIHTWTKFDLRILSHHSCAADSHFEKYLRWLSFRTLVSPSFFFFFFFFFLTRTMEKNFARFFVFFSKFLFQVSGLQACKQQENNIEI